MFQPLLLYSRLTALANGIHNCSGRLVASEPGARAAAFADGCAPALAGGLDGRIAAAITAERAPWYLTILYALLLFRRDHELEPLHEDLFARVRAGKAVLNLTEGAKVASRPCA